jgi:hypothetical protein
MRVTSSTRDVMQMLMGAVFGAAMVLIVTGGIAANSVGNPPSETVRLAADSLPPPPEPAPTNPSVVPPVQVDIPRLGVSAPVDAIGLGDDGAIAVPQDFTRTGWYDRLEAPGQVGTAVIVGHVDSYTGPAVFFRVRELRAGDEVFVTLADGAAVRFVVERTEQYDKRKFPTIAVYGPVDRPTLRLITCGGSFDRSSGHYRDNVVVYATAQEAT